MFVDPVVRERLKAVECQLEEIFSDFVIIGLPLDPNQSPVIASNGDEEIVNDLLTVASKKKKQ